MKLKAQEAKLRQFTRETQRRLDSSRVQAQGFGRSTSQRAVWANKKYLEKYSKIQYHKDGTILVTDDWKSQGKVSPPAKLKPNAVLETQTNYKNGNVQIDRTVYDESGWIATQIHSGPHNRPDLHRLGQNGEHAHDYFWDETGKLKNRIDRDLSESERKAHADLLKEGKQNE